MADSALLFEGERDAGGAIRTYFGIVARHEQEAGVQLLGYLHDGAEVCLRNDLDEGGEGCTYFRKTPTGISTMTGGHGWQSEWKPVGDQAVIVAVAELANLNRGGHWSRQGTIILSKLRSN